MNKILDKIFKSKVLSIIVLTVLVAIFSFLLIFSSFKIYEIVIGIGLSLLINMSARKAFNKPKIKVSDIIYLAIGITLFMYLISRLSF